MAVNGRAYDWESVSIRLPHDIAVSIEEISYNDERPIEPVYGKGSIPIKYGRKNYTASGSMTIYREEFEELKSSMGGSVYKGDPFKIVVSYADDGSRTVTDTLPDVKITKIDTSAKQGENIVGKIKLDFKILSPIKWNKTEAL